MGRYGTAEAARDQAKKERERENEHMRTTMMSHAEVTELETNGRRAIIFVYPAQTAKGRDEWRHVECFGYGEAPVKWFYRKTGKAVGASVSENITAELHRRRFEDLMKEFPELSTARTCGYCGQQCKGKPE